MPQSGAGVKAASHKGAPSSAHLSAIPSQYSLLVHESSGVQRPMKKMKRCPVLSMVFVDCTVKLSTFPTMNFASSKRALVHRKPQELQSMSAPKKSSVSSISLSISLPMLKMKTPPGLNHRCTLWKSSVCSCRGRWKTEKRAIAASMLEFSTWKSMISTHSYVASGTFARARAI